MRIRRHDVSDTLSCTAVVMTSLAFLFPYTVMRTRRDNIANAPSRTPTAVRIRPHDVADASSCTS